MIRRTCISRIFTLTAILTSCQWDRQPPDYDVLVKSINLGVLRPPEEPLLAIALVAPKFGGYYCNDGDLIVLLQEPYTLAETTALQEQIPDYAVAHCHRRDMPQHAPEVIFRGSKYGFLHLRAWRDSIASEFLDLEGAISIAIDYHANRLVMGIVPERETTIVSYVNYRAESLSIPSDGYQVVSRPRRSLHSCPTPSNGPRIHDDTVPITEACFRPVTAGVAAELTGTYGQPLFGGCTIGSANDRYMPSLGYWLPGYTINSHCTPPMFSVQNDWLWQSTRQDGSLVAIESVDPPYFGCGAFNLFHCRYSDSAWLQAGSAGTQHGTIAKTTFWSSQWGTDGSKVLDSSSDRFLILGKASVAQGVQIEKMGARTGWTTGAVTHTCKDENLLDEQNQPTGIRLLCQSNATYYAEEGDSGGPVFFWRWFEGGATVDLLGIHWGAFEGEVAYSHQDSVEAELGTLFISYPYF